MTLTSQDGAADVDGRIRVGDVILAVSQKQLLQNAGHRAQIDGKSLEQVDRSTVTLYFDQTNMICKFLIGHVSSEYARLDTLCISVMVICSESLYFNPTTEPNECVTSTPLCKPKVSRNAVSAPAIMAPTLAEPTQRQLLVRYSAVH